MATGVQGTRNEPDEENDPMSDPEERRVLCAALGSYHEYRRAAHYNITHLRRQSFYSLPSAHIDILSEPPFSLPNTFDAVDDAIDSNADISEAILSIGITAFGFDSGNDSWKGQVTPSDLDKARSTIRQLYRDWSAEGAVERHAAHHLIFNGLETYVLNLDATKPHQCRILVPGAGLGRLVLDICLAGYTVEGNEISYHQLLASNYILNHTKAANQHTLYPWALGFSNHLHRSNQLQSVSIPDIHPATALDRTAQDLNSEVHYSERMSMTAGDFCVLYRRSDYRDMFDAVTTCFFVDTAPNVLNYIETIKHCLRPGGLWINVGPLLWHFEAAPTPVDRAEQRQSLDGGKVPPSRNEGIGEPGSFELSDAEVVNLVEHVGFEILVHTQASEAAAGYIQDPSSMLQNLYRPSYWVARKK